MRAPCPLVLRKRSSEARLLHAIKEHPGKPKNGLACRHCDFQAPWALKELKLHHQQAHPGAELAYDDHREELKALIVKELFMMPT